MKWSQAALIEGFGVVVRLKVDVRCCLPPVVLASSFAAIFFDCPLEPVVHQLGYQPLRVLGFHPRPLQHREQRMYLIIQAACPGSSFSYRARPQRSDDLP